MELEQALRSAVNSGAIGEVLLTWLTIIAVVALVVLALSKYGESKGF